MDQWVDATTMAMNEHARHLQCPFCEAYEVERLYLASLRLDSCACASCGARWDEDPVTGDYKGRGGKQSV
ncbi:MAG: hypothetical protein ACRDYW_13635, partial [Acidimicrobiales bacterium]